MEKSAGNFPFRKLRYDKYLTLEVMMYVEHQEAYKFMFTANKEARTFFQQNIITIQNGFINDGLITYSINEGFNDYQKLEKLYFQAIKRNVGNRKLTIETCIGPQNFKIFNEIIRWIEAQQQHIELKFKYHPDFFGHQCPTEFLIQNKIIELGIGNLSQKLSLNDTLYQSLRCLKIWDDSFIEVQSFKSLQFLGINLSMDDIKNVIPYFASKFNVDLFKRMHVNLFISKCVSKYDDNLKIGDEKNSLDQYRDIAPKHIQINTGSIIELEKIKVIQDSIGHHPSIISFHTISVKVSSIRNFEQLETLSNLAKKVTIFYKNIEDYTKIKEFQVNYQSVTDELTFFGVIKDHLQIKLLNVFKNIKRLTFSGQYYGVKYFDEKVHEKINLPLLQTLQVSHPGHLKFFTGLKSLKNICLNFSDKVDNIHEIFDPQSILEIEIFGKQNIHYLCLLGNLRSLKINTLTHRINFEQFLPQMNFLTSLNLIFGSENVSSTISETLDQLCQFSINCQSLRTITIDGNFGDNYYDDFAMKMIKKINEDSPRRSHPLTLIFSKLGLDIKTAIRLMQVLESDNQVNQKLFLQFSSKFLSNQH